MKNSDKLIAAFLVSVGVFSSVQAMQYVSSLSAKEKALIADTAKKTAGQVILCSAVGEFNTPVETPNANPPSNG